MRRIALGLAGAAAALAAALAATSVWRPLDGADAAVLAALKRTGELSIEATGKATVSLFPTPRIHVDGVSMSHAGGPPFAVARELIGAPRLAALLFGRLELGEVTLRGAEVDLERLPIARMFAAAREATSSDFETPEIRIVKSRLNFGGRSIEDVEIGLVWPSAGRPLSISGYGAFGGRPLEATFLLSDPQALGRRQPAPFRVRFEGGGGRIVFDGTATDADQLRFTGDLNARAASLRETLKWLGAPAPRKSSPLSGFSLAGKAVADKDGLSISNAELGLEGDSYLGAGRLTTVDGRAKVEATLDADKLNLKPFVKGIAPTARQDSGGWSEKPIALNTIKGFDLDLRLSAGAVKLGPLRLESTAATVLISNGVFDLSIGEATAFGGSVGGRLSIAPDRAGTRVRAQASLIDVDAKDGLRRFVDQTVLTGALSADFSVEGAGRSMADIVASLAGQASARVVDGSLEGVTKSRALALVGLRGDMPFSTAGMSVTIKDGVAHTDDLKIDGTSASVSMSGDARLVERDLKLEGLFSPSSGKWSFPLKMEGPLWAPKVKSNLSGANPQVESRHSGSAIASGR